MKFKANFRNVTMTCLFVLSALIGYSQTPSFPSIQQGNKLVGTGATGAARQGYAVAISGDGNTAIVGGTNDNTNVGAVWIYTKSGTTWSQQGNKLVGTGNVGASTQGISVALSADGNTALVGGRGDNSNAGAVWVFTRTGTTWAQQGTKLVGTGAVGAGQQGFSVSLSSDGNTALVGGCGDNSNAGAVWIFTRSGTTWTQQGTKLVGTGATGAAYQGWSVALSSNGTTALVGGSQDNSQAGASWVFTRSGTTWTQQGTKLVGTGAVGAGQQGISASLSSDGNTAMVCGYGDNNVGAAWVFTRSGTTWTQQGTKLAGTGTVGAAALGSSVSLSSDGNTAIIGGYNDNSFAGASWVFTRTGSTWTQQGSKLIGTGAVGTVARQGSSVSISADGRTAFIGAFDDNSSAGAAWVYSVSSPGAPTITSATSGAGRVFINFTAPANDGGSAITNYQYSTDNGTNWTPLNPVSVVSPIVISGLSNCTAYNVQIRAVNSSGNGTPSATAIATPRSGQTVGASGPDLLTPDKPVIGSITPLAVTASVAFTAPSDAGSSAISNYEYSTNNGTTWVTPSSAVTTSPLTISGLTPLTSYQVQLRAVNAQGFGCATASTNTTTISTPGAPTITSATVVVGGASVVFTAPSSNGGATITNYEYSTDNGSTWTIRNPVSTASPLVASMSNCSAYTVRIRAVSSAGSGTSSAAVNVTPTINAAPVITWAKSGTGKQICSGVGNDTLKFTAVTGVTYQWYKVINGTNVALANVAPYSGVATSQLVLINPQDTAAGTFVVTAKTTATGCVTSAQQTIVINPAPTVSIGSVSDNLGNLCNLNTSISFTAFPSTTSGVTYQWYKNDVLVTGATASSYSQSSWVSNDDIKCIIAVAAPGCAVSASATSNSLTVTGENAVGNSWQVKSNIGVTKKLGSASFSIGNKGYLIGGTDNGVGTKANWEYDPFLNSWTQKADFPGAIRIAPAYFAIGNYGYVGGGTNNTSIANNIYYPDYYKYYPPTNSWTQVADQPMFGATPSPAPYGFTPCGGTAANPNTSQTCATPVYSTSSFSIGKKGYVIGGDAGYYGAADPRKETWIYDPTVGALGTWTRGNDYPSNKTINLTSFVIGNNSYVGGGLSGGSSTATSEYYKLDGATNLWSQIASNGLSGQGLGIGLMGSFTIGNYGYIYGGYNNGSTGGTSTPYFKTRKYDPVANTWTALPDMTNNALNGGFTLGNKGYSCNTWGTSLNTTNGNNYINEYTPNGLTIKTGPIVNTSLCLGSTINVPYSLGCNSTTSFAGDFIVQLSDSLGTFLNPTEIGRAAVTNGAGTSGSISATIPTNSKLSNQYRIRIVSESSSSPASNTIGYMNDALITVGTVPTGGEIGINHTVPYPAELTSDAINNVTLPNTSVIALSSTKPYTWQKTTNTISGTWTNIANANGADYNLPLTAQVDTFYRRMANFACLASVPSNVIGIKVFSAANNKLNGSISGKVKTVSLTGVSDINITIQKTSVSLLGSPITKVYTTTTGNDGKYIIPNIFYGDINNGDPTSVTFLVKAYKENHAIENSEGVIVTLSNTNPTAINIDFTDNSALSINGAVTTSMEGVNGGDMDSVNSVRIRAKRISNLQEETPDTTGSQGYGNYAITVVDQIPYRFIPVYKNHKFVPAYRDITVTGNIVNVDFYDSTFNTISGIFRASGGSEIIGRAVIKFEDTVNNRPGVKFTKTITTNTDGSYSVTLPARKYKATVMSFIPANNQTNDINPTELLEFFNIRQKDSSIIDIDTMNRTKDFIYHRKPLLTFQNLPDSCGKKVFRQNQEKTFIVNIWEGDPIYNYKVVTDSTDSLRLVTNVAGDVNLDTTYYNQANGSDTITLKGGSPNSFSFENYLKTFKLDYKDKFGRSAATLAPPTVVLGLKTNRGTFVTVSPEVPLLILHAPPGDQSSCTWTENTTNETEYSFSLAVAGRREMETKVSLGVKAQIGIGFATQTDIQATGTNTLKNTVSIEGGYTAVFATSSSTSYSTEPGGGDVYIGAALNLKYAIADELMFNDTASRACELFNKSRFVIAPDGFATTYTYSEGQIKDVIIPTLQAMADNATTVTEQKRYLNQVSVWNQVIENNNRNKANARFKRNRSFDGNAGPIVESTTESSTSNNTIAFGLEIENDVAVEAEAKVSNNGGGNKVTVGIKLNLGGSRSSSTTKETSIEYTLDDDDEGDYFSVDIKKDQVYKTPVFELVAGTSSCPAEEIAQNRDAGRLDIPEEANGAPNKIQTNIPATNEAIYQLKLRNLSESRETRTYNLEFDQSSNPNGAIVTIGGNPSNVPVSYTIPYLGTQIVTVTVKKNAFSNVYSYEGLNFVMTDGCEGDDEEEVSSNTLSAYFASPCSNITLVSPTDGWLSNASGNNIIPISFNGYNVNNLQSVTLQYAHTGRGDWQPGLVLNQNAISNTGTQNANWNISNVQDGNYEIRLQLLCVNGTVFSVRYTGTIDRKAPQLFGAPQPADRLLSLGDDISYSFDENIVTSGLNNNVKLTKISNDTEIPIQVTGYGNKVNIVSETDLFANYYGDSLRLVIKNIADLNGNIQTASDTIEFLVGGTSLPIADNVKKKRVSISNVNPTKTSIFENSGDSLMVKFKFDTTSNTTSRTLVRYVVGGTSQYNSGYTVSYSNGQSLATVYNGTEGSITIPAYQDSAILTIKPLLDAANEPDETITLSLISGGDYTISDKYLIKDTIKNDDNLGTPIITTSGSLCEGGNIMLSTDNMIDGQPVNRYVWKSGSTIVGTAQNLMVTTSGDYTVTVYNSGNFSGTSNVFAVTASEPPTSISNVSICTNQLPFSWNDQDYNAAGTYLKTISNAEGCDSIAVLNLAISAPISTIEEVNAVDSFEWHGNLYYASTNTPTWMGTTAAGCDSLVTLNLTMSYTCLPVSTELYVTACNSYMWRGIRFYSSTEIEWIGATARGGCDSVVTLHLTINKTSRSTTSVSLCASQLPYSWNGLIYSTAGNYTKQMTNAAGCDSIATLVLSVKLPTSSTQNVAVCANDMPYTWNGVEYNSAGTYVQNLTNAAGCDSTASLVITVKQVSTSNHNISICSSQLPIVWNGLTLTAAGNYIANLNSANGCDSLAILNLTVKQVSYVTETINATGTSYTWHGVVYTSSNNTATWTGTNAAGCDSIVTLDLTLTNDCVPTTRIINVTACSTYTWRGIRLISSTTLEWVGVNAGGCDSIEVLNLTITSLSPTASPASITQTLVNNTCGARVYRYTAAAVTNATGYAWNLPVSVGGVTGVFVDSGDASNSRIILVRYASTLAAFTTDSVRVRAFSPCATTSNRTAKLINTLFSAPAVPASITITPIVTNVCGAKRYRYAAPALPTATTTTVAATGYIWQFKGVLGATIDSGTANSRVITVTFSNNAAASTGDSVKLCYTSACGNSLFKASILTNTLLSAPLAPATVTITPLVTNVCGARKYRYTASGLTVATTTAAAATGWLWSLPAEGTVGSTGVLDSGTINSQTIVVVYSSNAAAIAGDSIRVRYTSYCGLGATKATKLTNTLLGAPLAPATITIATVSDICGARVYRYTAPVLPSATTTAGAASGYLWHMPKGTLGLTGVLDSGSLNSRVIKIRYSSNVAALTGDSIKVQYTSACGNSVPKAQKLSNVAPTLLAAPSTLTGTTSICSIVGTTTSARYTATTVTGAQYYVWTLPSGAVIDSGSNGLKIKVLFNTAGANDSIYVQAVGINGCTGTKKVMKLVTTGCVTPVFTRSTESSTPKLEIEPMRVNVYPNPTTSAYQLFVKSSKPSQIIKVRVFDVQGRVFKTFTFNSSETVSFGNELKAGVYFVEVREGDEMKTMRVVKY